MCETEFKKKKNGYQGGKMFNKSQNVTFGLYIIFFLIKRVELTVIFSKLKKS